VLCASIPENEFERLLALARLNLLDTPPEPEFDAITALASRMLGAPICLVSLIDSKRQWFKARVGLEATETPRDVAFCAHAILGSDPLVVPDSAADERFADNPLVMGAPHVRSYVGVPLVTAEGHALGTLCAIDNCPRPWTEANIADLRMLAGLLMGKIADREKLAKLAATQAELVRVSEQLDHTSRFFREVTGIVGAGGWRLRIADHALEWTAETWKLHAVPEDYVPDLATAIEFYAPEARDTIRDAVEAAIDFQQPYDLELPLIRADGQHTWVRAAGRPVVVDGRVTEVLGAFQDVSEAVHARAQMQDLAIAARAAARAKEQFLASISHEIRTPLNGVLGLTNALARTDLSGAQREMVSLLQGSGESLERMLTDLLDLTKIDAGHLRLENRPFDLGTEVRRAAEVFKVRADEKALAFRLDIDPACEAQFIGDAVRLRQIVANLTANAVKFTAEGEVVIALSLSRATRRRPAQVVLRVTDTGIGFTPEAAARLFQRFEQADASIAGTFGGTGLGLSICKALVDQMGGTITATGRPQQGATFTVSLPLPRAAVTAVTEAAPEELSQVALKLLLVDDNAVNRRVIALMLEPFGINILSVDSGAAALEAFADHWFDLVLMDMQMPGMDGLEATRRLRAMEIAHGQPRTPVLMLSANVMESRQRAAAQAGCDGHVSKPVTPQTLLASIQAALAGATTVAEPEPARAVA
jgi:signal transduction histidine kinase/ActR/RegA family two-component response regulator